MRYTTWQDVVARYPAAAKIASANDGESFDNAFGQPAEATVDASLALRYTVPVATTPTLAPFIVRDVSTDLAYWKMAWMQLTKEQEKILRDSIDQRLTALSTGSMALVGSGGVVTAPSLGVWGTHQDYRNVSGMDCHEDWAVSSAELQAAEDSRL